jgi:hypothetical protein
MSKKLLGERGIEVDHVTIYRWVQRFTPLLADAAGPCRHPVADQWFVDETYVKVAGRWRYVYRAVDQAGQVIDVSSRLDVISGQHAFQYNAPLAWRTRRGRNRSRTRASSRDRSAHA